MQAKRIKALKLLLLCFAATCVLNALGTDALTGHGWLVGQTFLDAEFGLGITGNIALGSCGIFWSSLASIVCPWCAVAIAL